MAGKYKPMGTSSLFPEEFRLKKTQQTRRPSRTIEQSGQLGIFPCHYWKNGQQRQTGQFWPQALWPLLMFKILILQRYYNLGDNQIEFQILDRLTFCRFLGLSLNDRVPDEKTVWDFRDRLINKGLEKELFDLFDIILEKHGLIAHEGKIIDASFVEAPVNATAGKRTNKSRKARFLKTGTQTRTRKNKKM